MDYIVRAYGEDDSVMEWIIQDRTEDEARHEAEADIASMKEVGDWTLTPLVSEADTATIEYRDRTITVWENADGELEIMTTIKGGGVKDA